MGAPLFTTIPQADRKFVHFPVLNGEPMRILPPPTSVPFFQPPTPLIFPAPAPVPVPVPLYSLFSLVPSSSLIPFHHEGLPRPLSTPPLSALASSLFAPPISSPSSPSLAPFQMAGGVPLPERPVPLKAQLLGQEERASSSEDNTIEISQGETSDESVPSTPRELSPHVVTQESTEKRYLVPGKSSIRRGQDKEKRRRKIFEPAIRCNNDLMHIIRSSEDVTAKIFPIDQQIFKTEVVLYRGHIIASVDSGVTVNKPKITDGSKRASTQHNDCLRNLGFSEKRLAKRQKDGVTYFIKKIDAEDTYKLRGSC